MDKFKCPRCVETIPEDAEKCPKGGIAADNGSTAVKKSLPTSAAATPAGRALTIYR